MTPERSGDRLIRHEGYLPFSALSTGDFVLLSAGQGKDNRECLLKVVRTREDSRLVFSFRQLREDKPFYFLDQERNFVTPPDDSELISGFSTEIQESWGVGLLPWPSDNTGMKVGMNNWFLDLDRKKRWIFAKNVNAINAQKALITYLSKS